MNVLDKIVARKKEIVEASKKSVPYNKLDKLTYFSRNCISLKESLLAEKNTGIIAEFKRRSPSKDWINKEAKVQDIVTKYAQYGAAASSILTDEDFFGGSMQDLLEARELVDIPLLRKDFMIDEYQIVEAKANGADVILLIAAILTPKECKALAKSAQSHGLNVLLEIHDEEEVCCFNEYVDMVGVNNRNLKTFEVSIDFSFRLAETIPTDFVKVAESGITQPETIKSLREAGYKGFLIGENFMKAQNPGKAFQEFAEALK